MFVKHASLQNAEKKSLSHLWIEISFTTAKFLEGYKRQKKISKSVITNSNNNTELERKLKKINSKQQTTNFRQKKKNKILTPKT